MPFVCIDLLGNSALQLAKEINQKEGHAKLDIREIRALILQNSTFLDWQDSKIRFNELHIAPNHKFSRSHFGRTIANEETAWNESVFSNEVSDGKISWTRMGTTNHSEKEIADAFKRHGLDESGFAQWIGRLAAVRANSRRAQPEKVKHRGRRFTRWTHDVPFVARVEHGPAQAAATIRSQLLVPAFRCEDPEDSILEAEIELMDLSQHGPLISVPRRRWSMDESTNPPTSSRDLQELLYQSLPMLMAGVTSDLLRALYQGSFDALDEYHEQGGEHYPTVHATIFLPERYAGKEEMVAQATLNAVKNARANYFDGADETARMASLTVQVMSEEQKEKRFNERLDALENVRVHKEHEAEKKASMHPGDEFTLVKIDLPILTVGENERLYLTREYEEFAQVLEETGLPPQRILSLAQTDIGWIDKVTNYKDIDRWTSTASARVQSHPDWPFDESSADFAYDCIRVALSLRGLPRKAQSQPPTIWLVFDTATLFPYAEHAASSADLSAFMRRAINPLHPLSMGASPKRLKVAGSLLVEHPEIQEWAMRIGIEIVRPKSGFDAGSMHVKLWRKMVYSVMGRRVGEVEPSAWWCGVPSMSEQDLAKSVANKVRVLQDLVIGEDRQYGHQRIGLYPYLDGIDSVKVRRYLDWRNETRQAASQI